MNQPSHQVPKIFIKHSVFARLPTVETWEEAQALRGKVNAVRKRTTEGGWLIYLPDQNALYVPEFNKSALKKNNQPMELNPNNKVVQSARGQWHKIAALIMVATGNTEIKLTAEHVDKIAAGNVNIVLDARGQSESGFLTVRIVDDKTAAELAKLEGGRPQDS